MASPRLSTAGMSLQYAVETNAGARPTSGYTKIIEIKNVVIPLTQPNR